MMSIPLSDFFHAAIIGDIPFLKQYLQKYDGNPHPELDFALCESTKVGNLNVVEYLVAEGAHVGSRLHAALLTVSEKGYTSIVRRLLDHGADLCFSDNRALIISAEHNHFDVGQLLIEHGGDIHTQKDFPLRFSIYSHNLPAVQFLLKKGSDIAIGIKAANNVKMVDLDEPFFIKFWIPNDFRWNSKQSILKHWLLSLFLLRKELKQFFR